MTSGAEAIAEDTTVIDAARRMKQLDVGSLPICGSDDRLKGVITDRDIVVEVLADGRDPQSTRVSEVANGDGQTITIGADDPIEEALETMKRHQVRRLPVIDGRELVGIVTQADIARSLDEAAVGDTVEAISE